MSSGSDTEGACSSNQDDDEYVRVARSSLDAEDSDHDTMASIPDGGEYALAFLYNDRGYLPSPDPSEGPTCSMIRSWVEERDFAALEDWLRDPQTVEYQEHYHATFLASNENFFRCAPVSCVQALIQVRPEAIECRIGEGSDDDEEECGTYAVHCALEAMQDYDEDEVGLEANRNYEVLKLLFEAAPDVLSEPDPSGDFPLHLACQNKGLTICQPLLENLTDAYPEAASIFDRNGNLPIHEACKRGHFSGGALEKLLQAHPNGPRLPHNFQLGRLPLHLVADPAEHMCTHDSQKRLHYLSCLLEYYPAAVTTKDPKENLYPFMLAAIGKNSDISTIFFLLVNFVLKRNLQDFIQPNGKKQNAVMGMGVGVGVQTGSKKRKAVS
jgi:hypothetical protein